MIFYRAKLLIDNHQFKNMAKLTYNDINKKGYSTDMKLPSVHTGQRKLFVNELQFLNKYTDGTGLVIYAGGCPGDHLYELSLYYPEIRFIIIDPSTFEPKINGKKRWRKGSENEKIIRIDSELNNIGNLYNSNYRLFWLKDLCCSELINNMLTNIRETVPDLKYYLWSDIRTGCGAAGEFGGKKRVTAQSPTDGDILWNLAMQYNWVKETKPDYCMLKFRLPNYRDKQIDFMRFVIKPEVSREFAKSPELNMIGGFRNKSFNYPAGTIYLQPWCKAQSTESRLVISKEDILNLVLYNKKEYNSVFKYYNHSDRISQNNDFAIEVDTLEEYLRINSDSQNDIKTLTTRLDKIIPIKYDLGITDSL